MFIVDRKTAIKLIGQQMSNQAGDITASGQFFLGGFDC